MFTFIYLVCVCPCVHVSPRTACGNQSLLPPSGPWGLNSIPHAKQQIPFFSPNSLCQPNLTIFYLLLKFNIFTTNSTIKIPALNFRPVFPHTKEHHTLTGPFPLSSPILVKWNRNLIKIV